MDTRANFSRIKRAGRKTKIVATVGPASSSEESLRELILAGVNVFRLNFSHGTHESHLEVLGRIKKLRRDLRIPVAVLQDLSGPKIRISKIEGGWIEISDGTELQLKDADGGLSDADCIRVEGVSPAAILEAGHQVLLVDGVIELKVTSIREGAAVCEVVKGGRVPSRVGIAFPDSYIELPATTEKDLEDLAWGIAHGVDFVALSFVNNRGDVCRVREHLEAEKSSIKIIAKIERRGALENLEAILQASDGVMVARGDLGLDLPIERVPGAQKKIIRQANLHGVPVIVATQMMRSMLTAVRPTRAEVSDVHTAVTSGTDAVMLSEETAIGEHPVLCAEMLGRIAREAEKGLNTYRHALENHGLEKETVDDALAFAACAAATKIKSSALVACTTTGTSARLVARYRPKEALFGVSNDEAVLRQLSLSWGVIPFYSSYVGTNPRKLKDTLGALQTMAQLPKGSPAVIIGGLARGEETAGVLQVQSF